MDNLENIWIFYQKLVASLLDNQDIANSFIEEISMIMMSQKDLNLSEEILVSLYEKAFEASSSNIKKEYVAKDFGNVIAAFKRLKNIERTGWIARNIPKQYRENDAVHIMQMFALAYIYFKLDKTINLDKRKVYEMIIIHEIGETVIGDIREGTSKHQSKKELEKSAVESIFSFSNNGKYFIDLWNEFENKTSNEACFVYQLDKIDPILKAKILDKLLNRTDLYDDFYSFEEKRNTYEKGKVKELFNYSRKMEVNII